VKRLDPKTRLPSGPLVDTVKDGPVRRSMPG
jgi:hypothetical protein